MIDLGVDGFAAGLRDGGIAATAKHFPGLGAAGVNTDFDAQTISLPRKKLRADEELFAAFADFGGELVMLGLASYSAFGNVPAALDPEIATGELRGRLGFDGVSITDALDAAAAQASATAARSRSPPREAAPSCSSTAIRAPPPTPSTTSSPRSAPAISSGRRSGGLPPASSPFPQTSATAKAPAPLLRGRSRVAVRGQVVDRRRPRARRRPSAANSRSICGIRLSRRPRHPLAGAARDQRSSQ